MMHGHDETKHSLIQTKPEDISSGKEKISIPLLKELGYFDVPIKVAAARLGLGVTTLKRICRANNVNRWPYRKRKSLGTLINRTKKALDDGTGKDNMPKLAWRDLITIVMPIAYAIKTLLAKASYYCALDGPA
ncbi:TPA: hypothetical protein ACH3X3_000751 [Trebouxia sp. C0006]